MAKKGSRLREYEKNNRVLNISGAQEARQKKKSEKAAAEGSGSPEDRSGRKQVRINWVRTGSLLIALAFVVVTALSVKNIFDLKEREAGLLEEKERLTMIKEELQMQFDHIDSDEYMEEQARRQLHLVKGNELIFYFPENFQLEKPEAESAEETE